MLDGYQSFQNIGISRYSGDIFLLPLWFVYSYLFQETLFFFSPSSPVGCILNAVMIVKGRMTRQVAEMSCFVTVDFCPLKSGTMENTETNAIIQR